MVQGNDYAVKSLMDTMVEERLREAEARRLLRLAGLGRRGWLLRQGRRLLYQVGRVLVILGQRLQQWDASRSASLESA